jgi:hypothetical protein
MNCNCESCRFYAANLQLCRRYPQSINKGPNDWCGEWRGEEQPAPKVDNDRSPYRGQQQRKR